MKVQTKAENNKNPVPAEKARTGFFLVQKLYAWILFSATLISLLLFSQALFS